MAKIISLVNQKGGVGKTTTAINLSTFLAQAGKSVLLVDLDPQGNASSGIGFDPREIKKSLYNSLILNEHPADVIIEVAETGHHLFPANQELAGASVELSGMENREFKLLEVLGVIRDYYDYIIIDSPPSLGLLTINGLVASDAVIVPVQTEYFALEGLGQLLNTIDLVQENLQPRLELGGIVMTMFDRRNRLARQVVKEVRSHFKDKVFDSVVPRTVRLAEAPSFGQSILYFDKFNKGSKAYRQLAQEVINRFENKKL